MIRRIFRGDGASVALVFVLLIIVFMITAPQAFLGYRLYMSFMATVLPPVIIALGVNLVAVAGEMDLSFPLVLAAASYVFGILFQQWDLTWLAMILAVSVGTTMGLINSMVITLLGIPSLIATLAAVSLGSTCNGGFGGH
jgi:simple sugar transport system permease protein